MRRFKIVTSVYFGAAWYEIYEWKKGWLWGGRWDYVTADRDKEKLRKLGEHLHANPPEEFTV